MLHRTFIVGILVAWAFWIPHAAFAQAPSEGYDCEALNLVVVVPPGTSYDNECPETHYVVQRQYFEQVLAGHESALLMQQALAERDSLIHVFDRKAALLDSTWQTVSHLSENLSAESLHALRVASDSLSRSVLPQLDAARRDLDAAAHRLDDAHRKLFWSRVKFAALPTLAGVGLGFLLAR